MGDKMAILAGGILLFGVGLMLGNVSEAHDEVTQDLEKVASSVSQEPTVPACQEDEIVVGHGDFKPTGYWNGYGCEALDDVCLGTWAAPEVCEPALRLGYRAGYEQREIEGVSP